MTRPLTPAQHHAIEAAKRLRAQMADGDIAKARSLLPEPLYSAHAWIITVSSEEYVAFADAIDALQQEEADGEAK